MKEKTILERVCPDLAYVQNGDYQIPNIVLEDYPEQYELNRWGRIYMDFFEGKYPGDFDLADLYGVMNPRAYEVGQRAQEMFENIIEKVKKEKNYDEVSRNDYLKGVDIIKEAQAIAEETVLRDVVYDDDLSWEPDEFEETF